MTLINIQLNEQELARLVQEEVRKLLPYALQHTETLEPITIDLKKISEITGLSASALRNHVLYDPRIQATELNFVSGKRLWDYQSFKKVYLELARNNDFTKL
jgi:hypothetical protein